MSDGGKNFLDMLEGEKVLDLYEELLLAYNFSKCTRNFIGNLLNFFG